MNPPTQRDIDTATLLLVYLRKDFAGARMAHVPILQLSESLARVIAAAAEKVTE